LPNIIQAPSPNFGAGRNGRKIVAIVDHITDGAMPGCLQWLQNPASQVSAHYVVARAGDIYKLVAESDSAWHCGIVDKPNWNLYDGTNPNHYTIGIEHEGTDGTLTAAQYQSTLWLHKQLVSAYAIPVDNNHIIGHCRLDTVNRANCPGPNFPWAQLFSDLMPVTIIANGQAIAAQLIDGSTWGQIADVLKAKGISYVWDLSKRIVCIAGASDADIPATAGVTIAAGKQVIAGQIITGNAWAPMAAVCSALGIKYAWNAATKTMTL
jgi:N-acetyl-anhydromuramyl-L-alanine amidase AmpD